MTQKYIAEAVRALEAEGGALEADAAAREAQGAARGPVVPCSREDVDALQAMLPAPYKLPAAYVELLLYGGRSLAGVFQGIDFSFEMAKALLEHGNRDIVRMLQASAPGATLPPDVLVISEHQGSNFTYVRLTEGDDPPVYFWEEGEGGLETSVCEHPTFSAFVTKAVKDHIAYGVRL